MRRMVRVSKRSGQRGTPRKLGAPKNCLYGKKTPRIFTEPLRPLNRNTSLGWDIIDFAEAIGEPLDPWQKWLVIHAFELLPDGTLRFRTILVLVARQNGKSHLKRVISLWRLYIFGSRLILGIAQDESLAREQMDLAIDTIHACSDLEDEFDRVSRTNGNEYFSLVSNAKYRIKASNRKAGRGWSVDELNIDELREQRDWTVWAAVSKTTMARENGQNWCMSNAGDDNSVVLNQLREAALKGRDPSIGIFEWSAPENCEMDDPKAWAQANPGLGYRISEAAIRSALGTDTPEVFRTEVLCQRVEQLEGAIDLAAWKDCADAAGSITDQRIALCLDVGTDGRHATLVKAALMNDGRPRIELVKAWPDTDGVRNDLPGLLESLKPAAIGWYPGGPAAAVQTILRPPDLETKDGRKMKNGIEYVELFGQKVTESCQETADLVSSRRLLHSGEPLLTAHIANAKKLKSGDGWRFTRIGPGYVDGAYAVAGAIRIVHNLPVVSRPAGVTFL